MGRIIPFDTGRDSRYALWWRRFWRFLRSLALVTPVQSSTGSQASDSCGGIAAYVGLFGSFAVNEMQEGKREGWMFRAVEVLMPSVDTLASDTMAQSLLWPQCGFMQLAYAPATNQLTPRRIWSEPSHAILARHDNPEGTRVSQESSIEAKDQQTTGQHMSNQGF